MGDTAGPIGIKPIRRIAGSCQEFRDTMGGSIASTNNQGENWSSSIPGYWGIFEPLHAISFLFRGSLLSGWAIGDSGLILHHQRGGPSAARGNWQCSTGAKSSRARLSESL